MFKEVSLTILTLSSFACATEVRIQDLAITQEEFHAISNELDAGNAAQGDIRSVISANFPSMYTEGNTPNFVTQTSFPSMYTNGNFPDSIISGTFPNSPQDSVNPDESLEIPLPADMITY